MSLNQTPQGERIHIGLFGRRNAGKSSLMNALTNQPVSIVSEEKGTTTDPVKKAMELLPLGPVLFIDTPGVDDDSVLGKERIEKAKQHLQTVDMALLVVDATASAYEVEVQLLEQIKKQGKPYLIIVNKCDLRKNEKEIDFAFPNEQCEYISAKDADAVNAVRNHIAEVYTKSNPSKERYLLRDMLQPRDLVILVVPIDKAAPKGRLILPQQMVLREVLDAGAISIVVKEDELENVLNITNQKPRMVITDSQVFHQVEKIVPRDISLTSFSILMSRYKGDLESQSKAAMHLKDLKEGMKILISEGCSHHRQCDDIGTVKMPRWIEEYTGKKFEYCFTNGGDFPEELKEYGMIVHCGGCTLHENEMKRRLQCAKEQKVPMTNYGTLIAHMNGILERCLEF